MPHPLTTDHRILTVLAGDFAVGPRPDGEPTPTPSFQKGLSARLKEIIEAAGGRLELGPVPDFAAVFGTAHVDGEEPVRAVRAALILQRESTSLSSLVRASVTFRVGVHAVRVPWTGPDRPVGLRDGLQAARQLARAASPGGVLVCPATARAAAARFRFKQAGEAYEAAGEVETRRDAREERLTPTVGREAEIGQILKSFDSGAGEFFLIEGDAGVGKSRLLYEVHRRLAERNAPLLVASGRAYDGPPVALSAFGDLVRQAAGVTGLEPGDGARLASWISGHLEETIPDAIDRENCAHLMTLSMGLVIPTRVAQIEPARMRSETHFAWLRWLRALAARQPVVLCLEDLHWADDGTMALLESLAAGLAGERVTIVGTRRPAAKTPRGCVRLRLEELPKEATGSLAAELLRAPVSDALADFLFEQSGGHPYYIEELARYLVEAGLVSGKPLQLISRPRKLPEGLHGLLVARIDSMGHEDRETLKAASVFGRFFWSGLLEQALYRKVDRGIERARRRQIIVPRSQSLLPNDREYAFRHDLLRDAAYSLLTAREKSRLHRVVADLLEPHIGSGGRRIRALVAVHKEAAGKKEEPARLWQEAAEEALRDSAWNEALSYARDARRLGGGPAARLVAARALVRLARLDEALVEATAVAGSPDASAEEAASAKLLEGEIHGRRGNNDAFLAIVEKVAAANPPGLVLAEALTQKARVLWGMGRHEEALKGVQDIRSRAGRAAEAGDRRAARLVADSYAVEGQVCWKQGRTADAAAAYERVLAIAAQIGDRLVTASTLNSMGALHRDLHHDAEARSAFEQALGILREIGDRIGIATALSNLGLVFRESGDLEASIAAHQGSLDIFRQAGDPHAVTRGLKALSDAYLDSGKVADALPLLEEALSIARKTSDRSAEMLALRNLGQAHSAIGEEKRALEELDAALTFARTEGSRFNEAFVHVVAGEIHADAGRGGEAQAHFDEAVRIASERGLDELLAGALTSRSRLASRNGDPKSQVDAAQALEAAVRSRNSSRQALALGAQARAAAAVGEAAGARRHLDQALALAGRCHTLNDRLRLMADEISVRAATGDTDGARAAAAAAERLASESGATAAAARFRDILHR